jgi:hypothetical protein
MLSPNAMKRVADSCGVRVTLTSNRHEALRSSASRTVQRTLVVPIGNAAPLGGVHVEENGAVPPETVGDG